LVIRSRSFWNDFRSLPISI